MDFVSCVYALLIEPVAQQLAGVFDFNGRFGLLFLGVSCTVAYGLFRVRKRRGLTDVGSFWQFIGGSRVNLHRSALLDYRYYLVRAILKVALVLPLLGLLAPYLFKSADYLAFFTQRWGPRPQLGEHLGLALLYGLGLFLLRDFRSIGPFIAAGCGSFTRFITRRPCWCRRPRAGFTLSSTLSTSWRPASALLSTPGCSGTPVAGSSMLTACLA